MYQQQLAHSHYILIRVYQIFNSFNGNKYEHFLYLY